MPKDLLGRPVKKRRPRYAASLAKYDRDSFAGRLERLTWLRSVFPVGYWFAMPPETAYVFGEVKAVFIDGSYVATILLATAFVEHWLSAIARDNGFSREADRGLEATIACLRRNGLVHEYLLKQADVLRRRRNPFVHLKRFDHPERLTQRAMQEGKHPLAIMEAQAKHAITVMYAIATKSR